MMAEYYGEIKTVHVTCVALSGSLFASRALWVLLSQRALWRGLRVLPHLIDTLLLASGLTLAFLIHQYPFLNSDWLTAKVIGLIVYIALGVAVFRTPYNRAGRAVIGLLALTVFVYIVGVAFSKQPAGFLAPYL
ncbi:SirB2 family protein [Salinisphaera hydrothermalis]|uniref:SirB2 family protein n=1 Tax=Salinisphaera hydrothermalis TaxID=563188 RepID=UPI00334247D8